MKKEEEEEKDNREKTWNEKGKKELEVRGEERRW